MEKWNKSYVYVQMLVTASNYTSFKYQYWTNLFSEMEILFENPKYFNK